MRGERGVRRVGTWAGRSPSVVARAGRCGWHRTEVINGLIVTEVVPKVEAA